MIEPDEETTKSEEGTVGMAGESSSSRGRSRLLAILGSGRLLMLLLPLFMLLIGLEIAFLTGRIDTPTELVRRTLPSPDIDLSLRAPTAVPAEQRIRVDEALIANAPRKGSPDAPVTLIEFNDFQCPFCKSWTEEVAPQLQPYLDRGELRFVLLDIPLPYHEQAAVAARAAHCAREQGGDTAYWKMHDAIFASQDAWAGQEHPEPILVDLAADADLDGQQLSACLLDERYEDVVYRGRVEAQRLGITATPTFVLNGELIVGAQPADLLQELIERELAR